MIEVGVKDFNQKIIRRIFRKPIIEETEYETRLIINNPDLILYIRDNKLEDGSSDPDSCHIYLTDLGWLHVNRPFAEMQNYKGKVNKAGF